MYALHHPLANRLCLTHLRVVSILLAVICRRMNYWANGCVSRECCRIVTCLYCRVLYFIADWVLGNLLTSWWQFAFKKICYHGSLAFDVNTSTTAQGITSALKYLIDFLSYLEIQNTEVTKTNPTKQNKGNGKGKTKENNDTHTNTT